MLAMREQRIVSKQIERFPTEWGLYQRDEQDGEQLIEQSGDHRLEERVPASSNEGIGARNFATLRCNPTVWH